MLKLRSEDFALGRTKINAAHLPLNLSRRLLKRLYDRRGKSAEKTIPVGRAFAVEREAASRRHRVSIILYFGTKRRADIDNFNKLSLDALSGIVYEDDSQIAALHITRTYDKEHPRIELSVTQL